MTPRGRLQHDRDGLNIVSAFTGMGNILHASGKLGLPYNEIVSFEIKPHAPVALDENFPGAIHHEGSLLDENMRDRAVDVLRAKHPNIQPEDPNLVVSGGFPCVGNSSVNSWARKDESKKGLNNVKTGLLLSLADIYKYLKPQHYIAENVDNMKPIDKLITSIVIANSLGRMPSKAEIETIFPFKLMPDEMGSKMTRKRNIWTDAILAAKYRNAELPKEWWTTPGEFQKALASRAEFIKQANLSPEWMDVLMHFPDEFPRPANNDKARRKATNIDLTGTENTDVNWPIGAHKEFGDFYNEITARPKKDNERVLFDTTGAFTGNAQYSHNYPKRVAAGREGYKNVVVPKDAVETITEQSLREKIHKKKALANWLREHPKEARNLTPEEIEAYQEYPIGASGTKNTLAQRYDLLKDNTHLSTMAYPLATMFNKLNDAGKYEAIITRYNGGLV